MCKWSRAGVPPHRRELSCRRFVCLDCIHTYLSIYLSVCLSIYLSIYLSSLSSYLSIHRSMGS